MVHINLRWPSSYQNLLQLLLLLAFEYVLCEDFNNLLPDGSYSFGYNNPDSYHHSQANRNNVVRGEFGSRNPGSGAVDSIQYTAGPRGFRPRGKNVVRKYDFNQVRTRPVGSPDDPYFDPNEDPSYNFAFNTRTYNRQEAANRIGDVTGKYSYLDDVGERHNVEFIAGKNTGFHVKTAIPDNKPLPFSPLQYVGKRKPVPRGRTTVQRGLDGSYRFVSGGPDHRRTETSDSTGHVRGSYTYLDDKGVRHSVHYIAGPETGYRVLKNVKGPHLPTIYPFGRPEIVPPDFYQYPNLEDVFDTAASGLVKPQNGFKPSKGDSSNNDNFNSNEDDVFGNVGKPGNKDFDFNTGGTGRPGSDGKKPARPTYEDDGSDVGDIFGSPLGGGGSSGGNSDISGGASKPQGNFFSDDGSYKPSGDDGSYKPGVDDDGYRPTSGGIKPTPFQPNVDDGAYRPSSGGSRPGGPRPSGGNSPGSGIRPPGSGSGQGSGSGSGSGSGFGSGSGSDFGGSNNFNDYSNEVNNFDLFDAGAGSVTRPSAGGVTRPNTGSGDDSYIGITQSGSGYGDGGTLVTNIGDRLFSVPPGVSVRAHVQAIDLLPLSPRSLSPGDQLKAETNDVKAENSNIKQRVDKNLEKNKNISTTTSSTTEKNERHS